MGHLQTTIRLLLRHPGATRPELCRLTGLMPSAMHGLIALLLEQGIIERDGTSAPARGRSADRYRLRLGLGIVVGVSLRLHRISVGLFDISLHQIAETHVPAELSASGPESYTLQIAETVTRLLAQHEKTAEACLGLGITLPGATRFPQGIVEQVCGAPLWQDFPIAERLGGALNLPVLADRDVYAGIEYLELSGQVQHPECAAYLSIYEGIGASLMLDGRAFRGGHGLSGEIGHLTARKDGAPCHCGNNGCLELYCSDIGLVKQYNAQSGGNCQHVEEVLQKMQRGDEVAAKVVAQAISYLVDATSSILVSYDPLELIIYCRWLNHQKTLYFRMLDAFYGKIFTQRHRVNIRLLPTGAIHLPAAAALALANLTLKPGGGLMVKLV